MAAYDRITSDPGIMNGQPCIRGMRLTVRRVLEALAVYGDRDQLRAKYPELEDEDIREAVEYALAMGTKLSAGRCWGLTVKGNRCNNPKTGWFFCGHHRLSAWKIISAILALTMVVIGLPANLASIVSWWTGGRAIEAVKSLENTVEAEHKRAIDLLGQELGRTNIALAAKEDTISSLLDLVNNPPPVSERAKALARLIGDGDSPYARALKAIAEERFEDARTILEQDRKRLLKRNYEATGHTHYYEGSLRDAIDWYEQALRFGEDSALERAVAVCNVRLGHTTVAMEQLNALVDRLRGHPHASPTGHDNRDRLADALAVRGNLHRLLHDSSTAIEDLSAAVTICRELAQRYRSDTLRVYLADSLNDLGNAYAAAGRLAESSERLREAIERYTELIDRQEIIDARQSLASSLNNYALVLLDEGDARAAIPQFDRSVAMYRYIIREWDRPYLRRRLASTLSNRGLARNALSHFRDAAADLRNACFIYCALSPADDEADVRREYAAAQSNLGMALANAGDFSEALELYTASLGFYSDVVKEHSRTELLVELAKVHANRAQLYATTGNAMRALEEVDAAIRSLSASEPATNHLLRAELARSLTLRGEAHAMLGDFLMADGDFDAAGGVYRSLRADRPNSFASELSTCFAESADSLSRQRRNGAALDAYNSALELCDGSKGQPNVKTASLLAKRGMHLLVMRRPDEAVADFSKAIGILDLDGPASHELMLVTQRLTVSANRGKAYAMLGCGDQAVADCDASIEKGRELLRDYPDRGDSQLSLAGVLCVSAEVALLVGDAARALQHSSEAIAIYGKCGQDGAGRQEMASAYMNCGVAHATSGDVDAAMSSFERADQEFRRSLRNRWDASVAKTYIELLENKVRANRILKRFDLVKRESDKISETYEEAICTHDRKELVSEYVLCLVRESRLFSTHPEETVRNADRALEKARRAKAVLAQENAVVLDTLAAAYAEGGDFEEAVRLQSRVVELVADQQTKREVLERLELYQTQKPLRDKAWLDGR